MKGILTIIAIVALLVVGVVFLKKNYVGPKVTVTTERVSIGENVITEQRITENVITEKRG